MTLEEISKNKPEGANAYDEKDNEYFKWDGNRWEYYDHEKQKWFSAVLDPLYIGMNIKPLY